MHLQIAPTAKQHEALTILFDNATEYFLFGGGAGGGKTWIGCEWLLSMCIAYPGSRWFIGRNELKRLKETTLITFFKVCTSHGIPAGQLFAYNDLKGFITFHNGSTIQLLDLKYQPSDPFYETLGSLEFTGGWIEEAGECHFNAFDTLKSRIGRHMNDRHELMAKMFLTCNPKKNWLYNTFYRPSVEGSLPDGYKFLRSLVTDNPKIDKGYIDKLHAISDRSKKERLLYGNWEYDDDPSALIQYDRISDTFTNTYVEEGEKYITADIARYGSDSTVIMLWSGFRVEKIFQLKGHSITDQAAYISDLANTHQVSRSRIICDEDGVGGGVVDILGCTGFVNNSRSEGEENFANLKSQCYFKLADRINTGKLYIYCPDSQMRDTIIEELELVKQKDIDKDGKRAVLPKDKVKGLLGRSPDFADALMMREYFSLNNYGSYSITVL